MSSTLQNSIQWGLCGVQNGQLVGSAATALHTSTDARSALEGDCSQALGGLMNRLQQLTQSASNLAGVSCSISVQQCQHDDVSSVSLKLGSNFEQVTCNSTELLHLLMQLQEVLRAGRDSSAADSTMQLQQLAASLFSVVSLAAAAVTADTDTAIPGSKTHQDSLAMLVNAAACLHDLANIQQMAVQLPKDPCVYTHLAAAMQAPNRTLRSQAAAVCRLLLVSGIADKQMFRKVPGLVPAVAGMLKSADAALKREALGLIVAVTPGSPETQALLTAPESGIVPAIVKLLTDHSNSTSSTGRQDVAVDGSSPYPGTGLLAAEALAQLTMDNSAVQLQLGKSEVLLKALWSCLTSHDTPAVIWALKAVANLWRPVQCSVARVKSLAVREGLYQSIIGCLDSSKPDIYVTAAEALISMLKDSTMAQKLAADSKAIAAAISGLKTPSTAEAAASCLFAFIKGLSGYKAAKVAQALGQPAVLQALVEATAAEERSGKQHRGVSTTLRQPARSPAAACKGVGEVLTAFAASSSEAAQKLCSMPQLLWDLPHEVSWHILWSCCYYPEVQLQLNCSDTWAIKPLMSVLSRAVGSGQGKGSAARHSRMPSVTDGMLVPTKGGQLLHQVCFAPTAVQGIHLSDKHSNSSTRDSSSDGTFSSNKACGSHNLGASSGGGTTSTAADVNSSLPCMRSLRTLADVPESLQVLARAANKPDYPELPILHLLSGLAAINADMAQRVAQELAAGGGGLGSAVTGFQSASKTVPALILLDHIATASPAGQRCLSKCASLQQKLMGYLGERVAVTSTKDHLRSVRTLKREAARLLLKLCRGDPFSSGYGTQGAVLCSREHAAAMLSVVKVLAGQGLHEIPRFAPDDCAWVLDPLLAVLQMGCSQGVQAAVVSSTAAVVLNGPGHCAAQQAAGDGMPETMLSFDGVLRFVPFLLEGLVCGFDSSTGVAYNVELVARLAGSMNSISALSAAAATASFRGLDQFAALKARLPSIRLLKAISGLGGSMMQVLKNPGAWLGPLGVLVELLDTEHTAEAAAVVAGTTGQLALSVLQDWVQHPDILKAGFGCFGCSGAGASLSPAGALVLEQVIEIMKRVSPDIVQDAAVRILLFLSDESVAVQKALARHTKALYRLQRVAARCVAEAKQVIQLMAPHLGLMYRMFL